jgi:hypothetical protein
MEEHTLNNVYNCLNTNIYSNLVTSGGQSSNLILKVVVLFSTPVLIRYQWQLKTGVFLHWCLIRAAPLLNFKSFTSLITIANVYKHFFREHSSLLFLRVGDDQKKVL